MGPQPSWEPSRIDPGWFVHSPFGIHGVGHVERVRIHALAIAKALGLDERTTRAIERACAWHDIGRVNDDVDDSHGARSAGRAIELGLPVGEPEEVVHMALFAVRWHCVDDRLGLDAVRLTAQPDATEIVFKVLKDADGLDRVRIHDLDPAHLRLPEGRDRVDVAWRLFEHWDGPGR